jgi:hypothetical protein
MLAANPEDRPAAGQIVKELYSRADRPSQFHGTCCQLKDDPGVASRREDHDSLSWVLTEIQNLRKSCILIIFDTFISFVIAETKYKNVKAHYFDKVAKIEELQASLASARLEAKAHEASAPVQGKSE